METNFGRAAALLSVFWLTDHLTPNTSECPANGTLAGGNGCKLQLVVLPGLLLGRSIAGEGGVEHVDQLVAAIAVRAPLV